ncbi:MAG: hypothetical protein GY850_20475 [bacterium]|nr:hypothetical protein [bacterium]
MLAVTALTLVVTMGCSSTMNGVIRRDAQRVEFVYTDSRVAVAELLIVMPDGERFQGKTERLDKAKDMMEADAEDISAHFEVMRTFDGNVKANLAGSRGNMMKCRFKVADYIIGLNSGGFGLCQMADGRVMDVFF